MFGSTTAWIGDHYERLVASASRAMANTQLLVHIFVSMFDCILLGPHMSVVF